MPTCAPLNAEFCDEDYAQDANARVLLRKLRDAAGRFAEAFGSAEAFAAFFPRVTPTTRLAVARDVEAVRQLGLGLF